MSRHGLLLRSISRRSIRSSSSSSRHRRPLIKLALFSPDLLNTSAVAAGLVSVALCAVESLCGETFVHFDFDIIAASNGFVYKSLGMTLIESSHDLFAICVICVSIGNYKAGWDGWMDLPGKVESTY